ncbi:hypothetical protein HK096_007023, partial [Nowakowskiella sp. JEL0078]
MHHSDQISRLTRDMCLRILDSTKDEERIVTICRTLTLMTSQAVIHIDSQVQLLMNMLKNCQSEAVMIELLSDIRILAQYPQNFSWKHLE